MVWSRLGYKDLAKQIEKGEKALHEALKEATSQVTSEVCETRKNTLMSSMQNMRLSVICIFEFLK